MEDKKLKTLTRLIEGKIKDIQNEIEIDCEDEEIAEAHGIIIGYIECLELIEKLK